MKKPFLILLLLYLVPQLLSAKSLDDAMDEIAIHFSQSSVKETPDREIVIRVVNYHSKKKDTIAGVIENKLYLAMQRQFPEAKLVLIDEAAAGVGSDAVFVKASYEPKGATTLVRVQAVLGIITGELITQTESDFETSKTNKKTLVAVLDIEAKDLSKGERKAYSEIFRSELNQIDVFQLASSAEIDKLDSDAIQEQLKCTRDECAVIIGEQLGVERVISATLFKMNENQYLLSGKMMDIKKNSILVSRTVRHNGKLTTIDSSLAKLATKLTGRSKQLVSRQELEKPVETVSDGPGWIWHTAAISGAVATLIVASSKASEHATLAKDNVALNQLFLDTASTSLKSTYTNTYNSNLAKMNSLKSDVQTFNTLSALFITWEMYLIYSSWTTKKAPATASSLTILPYANVSSAGSNNIGFSLNKKF